MFGRPGGALATAVMETPGGSIRDGVEARLHAFQLLDDHRQRDGPSATSMPTYLQYII